MTSSLYRLETTKEADSDIDRVKDYSEPLETKIRRLDALAQTMLALPGQWKICPYYNKEKAIRVSYIGNWYSIFFRVDELESTILVLAILAQSEDLSRLSS